MAKWQVSMLIIGSVKYQFEFENEMKMNAHIPFSIFSENQNDDSYTDPSSVQFVRCDREL